ncbi:MAG: response regulator transcription factor [Chitinophagaceae bacterium]|nr:response regulator transcription factor [Chitinophagaceae bacterium]
MYNILMADDHILLRDALSTLINSLDNCKVVAVADNGQQVLQHLQNGVVPHLVILDLSMPLMDGYETTAWLQKNHPQIKILILTMYDSEIALIRLLQLVRGFLKKDIHPTELKNALFAVLENGYYYSHNATGKLASLFQRSQQNQQTIDKAMLTDTEISFLKLASTDLTYKEIAKKMGLTPRNVDTFRDGLFLKLDVKSRVGLAIYAVKNGIISF